MDKEKHTEENTYPWKKFNVSHNDFLNYLDENIQEEFGKSTKGWVFK
jgi:hypothetical protein